MKRALAFSAILCVALAGSLQAATLTNFENDPLGGKPNGWMSADSGLVAFSDSSGADLQVGNWNESNYTNALGTFYDDASYLVMDFSTLMDSMQLDFGNDDPGWAAVGDQAILTVFLGAGQVGQVAMVMNRDDLMNQTIAIGGIVFDRATFFYDVTGAPGLIEIVDNIQFTQASAVPVPGAVLLGGMGMGLVGWLRRRRSL